MHKIMLMIKIFFSLLNLALHLLAYYTTLAYYKSHKIFFSLSIHSSNEPSCDANLISDWKWSNWAIKETAQRLAQFIGEIPVFLRCPDVDPMHSQKVDIISAVCSLYLTNLAS